MSSIAVSPTNLFSDLLASTWSEDMVTPDSTIADDQLDQPAVSSCSSSPSCSPASSPYDTNSKLNDSILFDLSTEVLMDTLLASGTPDIVSIPEHPVKVEQSVPSAVSTEQSSIDPPVRKSSGGRKRKTDLDPEDKDAKTRQRILRNRAAAQDSRDKKRKYVNDLESSNVSLKAENERLSKRLKSVEEENVILSSKLDTLAAQLNQIQSQLKLSEILSSGFGFCQSAAEAKPPSEEPLRDLNMEARSPTPNEIQYLEPTVADILDSFLDFEWEHSDTIYEAATTAVGLFDGLC